MFRLELQQMAIKFFIIILSSFFSFFFHIILLNQILGKFFEISHEEIDLSCFKFQNKVKSNFQFKDFRKKSATSTAESVSDLNSNLNNCGERENFDLITAMGIYDDDDIQKALRKLEESRSMLDEPIIPPLAVNHSTN